MLVYQSVPSENLGTFYGCHLSVELIAVLFAQMVDDVSRVRDHLAFIVDFRKLPVRRFEIELGQILRHGLVRKAGHLQVVDDLRDVWADAWNSPAWNVSVDF